MASSTINTSYQNAGVRGVPDFQVMDTYIDSNLVAGAEPAIQQPKRILLGDSLNLAQFTVVGISGGKLVPATWNATVANGVKPIGVLVYAAVSGANNTTIYGEVFLTGCFNVGENDAGADSPLVWDASFDTLAKKTQWAGLPHFNGNPNLLFRSRLQRDAS
ncbi:hypothetical protein [Novosphingobium resinovorum]|uniref:Uncharacterized protein n=1 Tax=Novosphingobium resinovorum TaxID=158500 RepID=A0A1D8A383_9SPHN|nr:hypothetical protein [Novosphingobium resinovorum]AOR76577.1 hypothetical protein BES08_07305 [Novosphingobium resinovorum]